MLPLASTSGTRKHAAALLVGSGPPGQDTDTNAANPAVVGGCELVLRPENRGEYLAYDPSGQGAEWKKFWFHVGNFESPLLERTAGAPQVQESWSSRGPGGKQVETILRAIAIIKKNGVTGDHVVFSFIDRRTQPLQLRKHPAFRYEGT